MLPPVTCAFANNPLVVISPSDVHGRGAKSPQVYLLSTEFLATWFEFAPIGSSTTPTVPLVGPGPPSFRIQADIQSLMAAAISVTNTSTVPPTTHTIVCGAVASRVVRGTAAANRGHDQAHQEVATIEYDYLTLCPSRYRFIIHTPDGIIMHLCEVRSARTYVLYHGSEESIVLATLDVRQGQLVVAPGVDVAAVMVAMAMALETRREGWMVVMVLAGLVLLACLVVLGMNVYRLCV